MDQTQFVPYSVILLNKRDARVALRRLLRNWREGLLEERRYGALYIHWKDVLERPENFSRQVITRELGDIPV